MTLAACIAALWALAPRDRRRLCAHLAGDLARPALWQDAALAPIARQLVVLGDQETAPPDAAIRHAIAACAPPDTATAREFEWIIKRALRMPRQ